MEVGKAGCLMYAVIPGMQNMDALGYAITVVWVGIATVQMQAVGFA